MAGQNEDLSDVLSSITASSATYAESNTASRTASSSRVQSSAPQNANAASSSGTSGSSSIQWGPAITASPLPSSEANNDDNHLNSNSNSNSNQQSTDFGGGSGLSDSAKKVIICTTTIGGTLILALLIYALWRRRRGASYSEIVRFRPHSSTVVLSQMSEDQRLTALPIYRQERISIRSSRHESRLDLAQQTKMQHRMPSSLRKEWRVEQPADGSSSRPKTPKTPTKQEGRSFLKDATPPSRQVLEEPERALDRVNTLNLPIMRHSIQARQLAQDDAIQEHDQRQLESMSLPYSPESQLDLNQRWSWTNSQAPSTPRIKPPTRTSLTSLRLGSVASWVKSQRHDEEEQQRQAHKRGLSRPLLKNQAIKPVLAPAPVGKKLSKKSKDGRVGSLSSIFKPNPNSLIPQPLSPRLEEQNLAPEEQTSIEMTQKS